MKGMLRGGFSYETRIQPPFLEEEKDEVAAFLLARGLLPEDDLDYRVDFLREGKIAGTGGLSGNVMKCLAVVDDVRGEGLAAAIVSELEAEASRRGTTSLKVFTLPENRGIFESLGYRALGEAEGEAILLEKGDGIGSWLDSLSAIARNADPENRARRKSALVMNCNPFTLGHLALVREASSKSDLVFLFVVSEEASAFPFEVRLKLVKAGVASLSNVIVIPGSEYIISRATFPAYFLKDRASERAAVHARLDLDIFGRLIAKAVGATVRFVAEEPYSEVTALYNKIMKETLPAHGVEVVEIPRLAVDGNAVSASTVRRLIQNGKLADVQKIVPETTWAYLSSPGAGPVLALVASREGRH